MGLDDCEVRSAKGWHQHMTLALPAVVQATELDRPQHQKRVRGCAFKQPRGLSLPEIRRLLYRQWVARNCHRRRQGLKRQQAQL